MQEERSERGVYLKDSLRKRQQVPEDAAGVDINTMRKYASHSSFRNALAVSDQNRQNRQIFSTPKFVRIRY